MIAEGCNSSHENCLMFLCSFKMDSHSLQYETRRCIDNTVMKKITRFRDTLHGTYPHSDAPSKVHYAKCSISFDFDGQSPYRVWKEVLSLTIIGLRFPVMLGVGERQGRVGAACQAGALLWLQTTHPHVLQAMGGWRFHIRLSVHIGTDAQGVAVAVDVSGGSSA